MSISLQQLIQSGQSISVNDLGLSANRPLLMEIQTHLCQHGLLDPVISGDTHTPFRPVQPASGKLTLDTRNALLAFHQLANLHYVDNLLTSINLEQLLNLSDNQFLPIQLSIESTDRSTTQPTSLDRIFQKFIGATRFQLEERIANRLFRETPLPLSANRGGRTGDVMPPVVEVGNGIVDIIIGKIRKGRRSHRKFGGEG